MKRILLVLFLAAVSMFLFNACGSRTVLEENAPSAVEQATMPHLQGWHVDDEELTAPANAEPALQAVPVQLSVEDIPQGVEPAEFLLGLGYDSFAEHEFLQSGSDWVALRTNTEIRDLRIITIIPHDVASFDDGWQFLRHYSAGSWTRLTIDLLPSEPFVMAWFSDGSGITQWGIDGVSFVDSDGRERFFILRQDGGATHLEEFENSPHNPDSPRISIVRPSPEIELVAAWIATASERDTQAARNDFLQQFKSYTEFNNPNAIIESWVAFSTNMDLRDFQFFELKQACDPWVGDVWRPFYVGTVLGSQAVLPLSEPVVVPWHPGGTMPSFGISFSDENGHRRNFTLNSNEGSGFPPMFISEFVDRVYCPICASDTP